MAGSPRLCSHTSIRSSWCSYWPDELLHRLRRSVIRVCGNGRINDIRFLGIPCHFLETVKQRYARADVPRESKHLSRRQGAPSAVERLTAKRTNLLPVRDCFRQTHQILIIIGYLTLYLYRISVCGNIAATVMMMTPSVLPLYHAVLTTPNAALMNAMACRVFRAIKFGDFVEDTCGSLPFSTRPTFASSLPRSSRGEPQTGALARGNKDRLLTQIVFTPEPVESSQMESMSDLGSKTCEV